MAESLRQLIIIIYSSCAEFDAEIGISTWGMERDRHLRCFHIALQSRIIRNCAGTPYGHVRLPTKLPFLSKMDLIRAMLSKSFLQTFGYFAPICTPSLPPGASGDLDVIHPSPPHKNFEIINYPFVCFGFVVLFTVPKRLPPVYNKPGGGLVF